MRKIRLICHDKRTTVKILNIQLMEVFNVVEQIRKGFENKIMISMKKAALNPVINVITILKIK